jgi:hypothetical protein
VIESGSGASGVFFLLSVCPVILQVLLLCSLAARHLKKELKPCSFINQIKSQHRSSAKQSWYKSISSPPTAHPPTPPSTQSAPDSTAHSPEHTPRE